MNLEQAKSVMSKLFRETDKYPVWLWGPPGLGKTSICQQVADELGWPYSEAHIQFSDPTDLKGLLRAGPKAVEWVAPKGEIPYGTRRKNSIFVLDDLPQGVPAVQILASHLVWARKVGPHRLKPGTRIIITGNRAKDRSATYGTPEHLKNRCLHIEVAKDAQVWLDHVVDFIHPDVAEFIKAHPKHLLEEDFPADAYGHASPRTWVMLSDVYKAGIRDKEVLEGCVGPAAAHEFVLRTRENTLDVDAILADADNFDPDKFRIDKLSAVVPEFAQKLTIDNADAVATVMRKMPDELLIVWFQECAKIDYPSEIYNHGLLDKLSEERGEMVLTALLPEIDESEIVE